MMKWIFCLAASLCLATLAHAGKLLPPQYAGVPLQPEVIQTLDYSDLGNPPDSQGELRITLSAGGKLIATNDVRNVWLYRRDTGKRFALTPGVAPSQPFDKNAIVSLQGMRWSQDGTLYVWARLYGGSGRIYAGDANGPRGVVTQVPQHWPDDNAAWAADYTIPDRDYADEIHANARHIVWWQNRGHGDIALMTATRQGKPRVLVAGNWELAEAVFDYAASRMIYASFDGLIMHPLEGGEPRPIAGTQDGDQAMPFDAASRWLVVRRVLGGCDRATAKIPDKYICLMQLPAVADDPPAPSPAQVSAQPSFDCAKARGITEQLLCARVPLAALDVELAGLYRQALERSANPGALKKQQLDWLRQRDQDCTAGRTLMQARAELAVDTCLRERYGARIRLLRGQVAPDIHLTQLQGRSAHAATPDDALPPRFGTPQAYAAVQALGDEGLIAGTALQLGKHLVWLSDQGRGNVILRAHLQGTPGTLDVQRGSWELVHLLHDEGHLIYPSDDGLMLLDLASGRAHRIRQTAMADLPLTWNPATRLLTWSSPRLCGITEGGNQLGPQQCSAVLDMPRR